ncbi:Efflux pump [Lachnellula subtilissima]|uniref:Efflux pump n=1 Tax=Lachnellula subtilissima TaxID=602034 RepID=A0A8H8RWH7_9HELO|nr:Efflux pump [Lachnellula subtilissima]
MYQNDISGAGFLLSLRAGVNIVLFIIILPAITRYALSKLAGPAETDLMVARGSIVLMILGTLALSVSVTPALMIMGLIVYTLGTGFAPLVRSLVTSLVESHAEGGPRDIARIYAVIGVMEGIGSLVAGPGMASAFRLGISLGESWLGLPFLVAAILFVQIAILLLTIKL